MHDVVEWTMRVNKFALVPLHTIRATTRAVNIYLLIDAPSTHKNKVPPAGGLMGYVRIPRRH